MKYTGLNKKLNAIYPIIMAALLAAAAVAWMPEDKPVLYLAGDSTMADKPMDDNPERGWGQLLPLFADPSLRIENHAKNGRSTKSFIDQGLWQGIVNKLKAGDYVLIQFGHNDSKVTDSTRYAEAHTAYKSNLEKFVYEVRAKNAFPVLITPVNRRKFDSAGSFVDQHGDYPAVVREIARSMNVPMIDMHKKSLDLFQKLGKEKSKELFLHVPPKTYKSFPEGKEDNTHFNRAGAIAVARLVIEGMKEINLPVVKYFSREPELTSSGTGKVIGLDYYYNNEFKKDSSGHKNRFHYVWEDKEYSGFYEFGNLFENTGARISELASAPADTSLIKLDMYIIVDPDTKAETPNPNFIEEPAITNVTEWVNKGGVLLLFANDSGNCEFKNLNRLAEKFGIQFVEDRNNLVKGQDYSKGKFDKLPAHPVFSGVNAVYMKEICSINCSAGAEEILKVNGKLYMAGVSFGKGYVFAVGDPWIYNEYIDNRKIPSEFENYKAAKNLVSWLLSKTGKERK